MTRQRNDRAGFTLLELLVVLGIMALLAAISISALARFKQSSNEKFTDIQLRKAHTGLVQQYQGAVDAIKKETPPDYIINLTKHANGQKDMARARALHLKLRLRQEFPQTFNEVDPTIWNAEFRPALLALAAADPANPQAGAQAAARYAPKPQFQMAIGSAGNDPNLESAALLHMILSQSRAGSNFDVESVGKVTPWQIGNRQLKVFVDYFDTPVAFRRWADADDLPGIAAELSQAPYSVESAKVPNARDPEDPDGRLGSSPAVAQDWLPGGYNLAVRLFVPATNPTLRPRFTAPTPHPFDGNHRGPYVFSAGKDQAYGDEADLLSYRLQQSGKGN